MEPQGLPSQALDSDSPPFFPAFLRTALLPAFGIALYLTLPLGIYLLFLRNRYPTPFSHYFGAHFLGALVLLGAEGAVPRKLRPWYGTAIILGLWAFVNTGELALKDYYGIGFSPQVFFHFNIQSAKIALGYYWAAACAFILVTMLAGALFFRCRVRARQAGLGIGKSYSVGLTTAALVLLHVPIAASPLKAEMPLQTLSSELHAYLRPETQAIYRSPQPQLLKTFGITPHVKAVSDLVAKRPALASNLILIYLEGFDLQFTRMGHSKYQDLTPNLDALAQQSTYLDNYYSSEGFTIAGLVASQSGILPDVDSNARMRARINYYKDLPSLGDVLHKAGYYQIFMGGASRIYSGKDRFFKTHHYDETFGWEDWKNQPSYKNPPTPWGLYDIDLFHEALKQVDRLKAHKPFNLTLLTVDTHVPGFPAPGTPSPVNDDYVRAICSTDRALGWFVRELERRGVLADTTLVITSDHNAAQSNQRKKFFGDNPDKKIIGVFKSPGRHLPSVISTLGYSPDLAPTLLDLLGIQTNAAFICGKSLLAAIQSRTRVIRDSSNGLPEPIVETRPGQGPRLGTDGRPYSLPSNAAAKQVRQFLSYYAQQFHASS